MFVALSSRSLRGRWQAGLNTRLIGRASLGKVELTSPLKGVCTPTVAGPLYSVLDLPAPVDLAF